MSYLVFINAFIPGGPKKVCKYIVSNTVASFQQNLGGSTRLATVPIHLETHSTPRGDIGTELSAVGSGTTFILNIHLASFYM